MTNAEKILLKSICVLSTSKEMALTYMRYRFLTVSTDTFNKKLENIRL